MVAHSRFPEDVRVAREVRAAVAAGFDVTVVALREGDEARHERASGADVHRLPVSHRRGASPVRLMGEYVAFATLAAFRVAQLTLRRRFDLVQVHNPPDFLIAAALVPRFFGARVVLDIHDLSSDMFAMRFPGGAARAAATVLNAIERLACRFADLVVTVHEPYRAELARRSVRAEKMLVVMNTVDDALLPASIPPPSREPFRIVYHGTVTPHYGVGLLVEALPELSQKIRDVRLEIYGGGDAVPALRAAAEAHGVADRLELSGIPLAHDTVLRRVSGAAVGAITNLPTPLSQFALSTKLFEYVVLGIPVVVADLPTLRAHFDDRDAAFFRAGDADSLAAAILRVADDYDAALVRARTARTRYDDAYRWELQADGYVTALRKLVR